MQHTSGRTLGAGRTLDSGAGGGSDRNSDRCGNWNGSLKQSVVGLGSDSEKGSDKDGEGLHFDSVLVLCCVALCVCLKCRCKLEGLGL